MAVISEDRVEYALRFGGMCRDCADQNGTCPRSFLPCEPAEARAAIRWVLAAIEYGERHGYLPGDAGRQALQEQG